MVLSLLPTNITNFSKGNTVHKVVLNWHKASFKPSMVDFKAKFLKSRREQQLRIIDSLYNSRSVFNLML